ncbi:hypothetical protein, conserved [Plasmodium gonderi]|uniref:Protein ARV n=1 Tax=Plasmodium gonderi TaxID=77519 RepID=A0A1Y1JDG3_PLAGO|nr:hypothetical protein, conserved [Plasmodium gonderi]GAW80536.1 hypothetical protein, conserved [Plasmodium gonderi]
MICIKCGRCNSSLYTVYNKTNIKLNDCNRCNKICDEYMEKNTFLIFMNILFLKPEIYRHIIFNRLQYHEKFIHAFFLKMIILFLIINAYLHPNFESEYNEKSTLSDIFLMNSNFETSTENNSIMRYNCSSYTLFMYKYDDKHKLYGLYNIFSNSHIPNLVNIHKDKLLTCIFHNRYRDHNVCILNRKYNHTEDYDKQLIDIFLHNNTKYANSPNEMEKWKLNKQIYGEKGEMDKKQKNKLENIQTDKWNNLNEKENIWENLQTIGSGKNRVVEFVRKIVKYESIFKLKKNNQLLKNDIITLKNSEEYNNLFQIINVLVYYNIDDYKIVLEAREKETHNFQYVMKFLRNIFFYKMEKKKKNYFKSNSHVFIKKKNSIDYCPDTSKEFIFSNKCYTCDYRNCFYPIDELDGICKNLFKKINFTFYKNVEDITKKQNKKQDKFKIKQISMYSKLLFSDLDNEKYILKICNSSFSFKKLISVTINYILYFLFLCVFTYILKIYQQRKYKIHITMVKYNYLFMLFVLSNYPLLIYFILNVFNYNYINIYLNVYTIICNIIAYHIFISNDNNYLCYSIFSVFTSYILKNILMIKIKEYI